VRCDADSFWVDVDAVDLHYGRLVSDWLDGSWWQCAEGRPRRRGTLHRDTEPCLRKRLHDRCYSCFQYSREQARRALTPGLWAEEQALGACLVASNHT